MTDLLENDQAREVSGIFERIVGVTKAPFRLSQSGQNQFLKFTVGRDAPLYKHALFRLQRELSPSNSFRGQIGLEVAQGRQGPFPSSLEAAALLTVISSSTREVAQGDSRRGIEIPYIAFQNREDHQLAQAATQVVRGRRGVGKSTLIRRANEILDKSKSIAIVLDMQTYSMQVGEELVVEVFSDVCLQVARQGSTDDYNQLEIMAEKLLSGVLSINRATSFIKRVFERITRSIDGHLFIFLDDFHLVESTSQPLLLHFLHACVKGANGWLKVAGLGSLLNVYDPNTRKGLQVPGDAQVISLDLTLENPEAAEAHLQAILESFLKLVGYRLTTSVTPNSAFKRLVWATAGVPRDFLQMFARSVEHARQNRHHSVTLSDVNVSIGEFGQEKMNDLIEDARNSADELRTALSLLEEICLDDRKINAFLVKNEPSKTRDIIRTLSDLRMVHLIHQSITPDRAGERYEAYIIDYSIFTGFRRRPNVQEMIPSDNQFKASQLRRLPKVELK